MAQADPDAFVSIIVVENADGRIVGRWSLRHYLHAEGVEIDPAYRKSASVARALIGKMWQVMGRLDVDGVLTAADTSAVATALDKLGAQRLPIIPFYWPRRTNAEQIGARFHRSFEVSSGHPPDHPSMPDHDRAVGAAILLAFDGRAGDAEAAYNEWAAVTGFAPATFRGFARDGRLIVEAGAYTFLIAPSGVCEVTASCQV